MEDRDNGELLKIRIAVKRSGRGGRPTLEEYNSRVRKTLKTKYGTPVEIDADPGFNVEAIARFVESMEDKEVSELRKQMIEHNKKGYGYGYRNIGQRAPGVKGRIGVLDFETTEENGEKKKIAENGGRK